ncbi:CocE/NonD family hydrolase [Thiosulfatihalobacter marinus]|uniref:CocE/NonD family hydrolase n=1 Tax=Thiosulfatihalobacter marinus TaxID=2792481 RepID=UPI0018D81A35|nr:CocE/NonD family hydrolase [Thiosulfatihalobacter marinus]
MQIVEDFPFEVEETPHVAIPMPDGVNLSARIWRPVGAGPVPAILEYLPYRKRDGTAVRDALTHPYLAGHGYACVRVDMRGCGDSEGLFDDEYSEQELADGVSVIHWLAAQGWCSGSVGMMGISWGGFNGLQIAALAPEPLKAVVSICSTTDRYADDIHYKGGLMLGENPGWAATVLGWFALPPDPEIVGEGWREMWLERLENTPFLAAKWVEHQLRDDYWKHGSVCEDYGAIKAAVLSVGGWHDGYRNTMAHLVENLDAPVKGLVGPWNHKYPHFAVPGPRIDFLGEMLRWWDRWLKGVDNGAEDWPEMRVWVMDSVAPRVSYEERPGRWVAIRDWHGERSPETWHLNGAMLAGGPGDVARKVVPSLACGQGTGEYFPFGFGPGELPDDQRRDDALSCCFDSAETPGARDIIGAPEVTLRLCSDKARAQVAVRLCDLRPDGTSALIAHGFLNLRQRQGRSAMQDLPVGEVVEARVVLDQCAYHLPAGHRLRLAVSSSYWPFVWPEAEQAVLEIVGGHMSLPLRPVAQGDEWVFDPPKAAPPLARERLEKARESKRLILDAGSNTLSLEITGDDGKLRDLPTGLDHATRVEERFVIREGDPLSAEASFRWDRSLGRGAWGARVISGVTMRADKAGFIVEADMEVREGDATVFDRKWRAQVPRA